MDNVFWQRGFLPEADPLTSFPAGSELGVLDEIGRDLPDPMPLPPRLTFR